MNPTRLLPPAAGLALALTLSAACTDDDAGGGRAGTPGCNDVEESNCIFPFPSDFFRKSGGPYGQAHHLDFGEGLPLNAATEERISPEPFKSNDGYPVYPQITFMLPGAKLAGVAMLEDIGASLRKESRTLVVDAETSELVAHFTELDYLAQDAGKTVFQVRLANALQHGHRYVVAVHGMVGEDGQPAPAPRGFAALRDGAKSPLATVAAQRDHYEAAVFPVLERAGLARPALQLAWDFTTASEKNATSRMLVMRDRLYALIGEEGPPYTITAVEPDPQGPDGNVVTEVRGTVSVPSFMLPKETAKPRRLRLDAEGLPVAEGTEEWPFRIQIPRSLATSGKKAAIVQYGHGFLGDDSEGQSGWLRDWANREGFLILSCDMQGQNVAAGVDWFVSLPNDATNLAHIAEEPLQGIMNHLALQRLVKGRFTEEASLQKDGAPIFDPARLYYHGNSQGGTQGSLVLMASKDVQRAVLGVPGVAIGFLLARAEQWASLSSIMSRNYDDPVAFAALTDLVQLGWDKADATNFAPLYDKLPGVAPKQVLLQTGLEDAQVNNDVSRLLARLFRAKLVTPATRPVYGLEETAAPFTGANAYQEVDYGVPARAATNRPSAKETDTHERARRTPEMQAQGWHFLETGEVLAPCGGPCVRP